MHTIARNKSILDWSDEWHNRNNNACAGKKGLILLITCMGIVLGRGTERKRAHAETVRVLRDYDCACANFVP